MKQKKNHPQYDLYLPYWQQIRVFVRGMNDVKDYIQDVTRDPSLDGRRRNKEYKDRACYVNFPARTRNAFTGAVFRKPYEVELPASLEYLISNVDGADLTLEHLSKSAISNVIECGRHGLFVDYGVSAKIVQYSAENITDWDTDESGNLIMVELSTGKDTSKKLKLVDDVYLVEFYIKEELQYTVEPTKADGSRFNYIPFVFVGSVDNSPDVDEMPLWAIVDLTRGHLQNSADMEDIAKYMIPTPAVTAPNASWVEEMLPNGTYTFGDGSVIPLPEGGTATLLQAQENQMHSRLMEQKEEQLVKIGARIMTGESSSNKTAEATRIEYSSENSVLDNLVGNVETAIKWCLEVCGEFMGVDGEVVFNLNRDYYESSVDPQIIMAQANMLDRGIIGITDTRQYLRKIGMIERGDEEIDAEVSNSETL